MPEYLPRRERQAKQERLVQNLSGPLRPYLSIDWIEAAGGIAKRVTAFPPLVMVWCMIRQVLYADPSCRAVLAWVQAARKHEGLSRLSHDTSGYCKARQRLPAQLFPQLSRRVARVLSDRASTMQRWCGRRVLVADGSAFSMPDTPDNQNRFPQPCRQKQGCGFPVGVFVGVICLTTGAVIDAFIGSGKMHDLAMFYYVRSCFVAGDIFLADRAFSAYSEMALFLGNKVDSVVRLHQRRKADFRRGRVLGIGDHIVSWSRPEYCSKGLRRKDFDQLPPSLQVREIRYRVAVKGFRTHNVILATTLYDAGKYSAKDLAELYFRRWDIEVDFRHLKTTMQMDILRGHNPDVVNKEFWAHVLAYNLIRCLLWDAGIGHGKPPLGLSLKGAIQHLLPHWSGYRCQRFTEMFKELLLLIAAELLPIRPKRVEPRVRKRRPKQFTFMNKPRNELRKQLPKENY